MEILRDRPGMLVYREGNQVIKEARDQENLDGLKNAIRFHRRLSGSRYVPEARLEGNKLYMEYVQSNEVPLGDPIEEVRHHTVYMLDDFRQAGVIHGDLTSPNIIITYKDGMYYPVAIDWDQSNFWSEARPQKRPKPDSVHIWPAIVEKVGDPSRVIQRYLAIREHIEYYLPFGSFLDLGTHQGDFPAMMLADGMWGVGVDNGSIRSNCLDTAEVLWSERFEKSVYWNKVDIVRYVNSLPEFYEVAVILMLSTWAYLIKDFGLESAKGTLKKAISHATLFFFEHQLYGDGPGVPEYKTDEDVRNLLTELAPRRTISAIITLPVVGRDANRTVWKVE